MLSTATLYSVLILLSEIIQVFLEDYTFEMGDFFNTMMQYATLIFNALIPIGAIAVGLAFGVGMVLLIIRLVKGAIAGV